MKSFVLATLAGLALSKNGDACSKNADCGTDDTNCCVIATGGKFCKNDDCSETDTGTAPNAAFCEPKDADK